VFRIPWEVVTGWKHTDLVSDPLFNTMRRMLPDLEHPKDWYFDAGTRLYKEADLPILFKEGVGIAFWISAKDLENLEERNLASEELWGRILGS
jgi:hypothetical protein